MVNRRALSLGGVQRLALFFSVGLLIMLWIAGGASRADALGQTFSRAAAWAVICCSIVFLPAPQWRSVRPVAILYGCTVALVVLQLVPLPAVVWAAIPGRAMLAEMPAVAGIDPGWQPLTISRSATLNSLWSLVVPGALLVLMTRLSDEAHRKLVGVLLLLILASCILGLMQFGGAQFDHPLINDGPGEIGGPFANRNHFALFAALGTVVAPTFAFIEPAPKRWTLVGATLVYLLCVVIVLAVGSRGGFLVGLIGTALAIMIVRRELGAMKRFPSKVGLSLAAAGAATVAGIVALVILMGRAQSLVRLQDEGGIAGLRAAIRPTVYHMIAKYFPFGSGFGTFDPAYRIEEPTRLLGLQYINQAHNDLLQVALDGGLLGVFLILAALGWSIRAGWRAWGPAGRLEGRMASAMLLLIVVASAVDYPVRTPLIMAVTIMAAVWLARADRREASEVDGDGLYR